MSLASDYSACSCDYAAPEFMSQNVRTARKVHQCYECGCSIDPGTKYEETFGKWEGDISHFKTCHLCLEIRDWARISVPCFCWGFGEMLENIQTLVDEARPDMPAGWMFEWGRRMVPIRKRQRERRAAQSSHERAGD
jgi:hypothetical protein